MSSLEELMGKALDEMSVEDLEARLNQTRRMQVSKKTSAKKTQDNSNKTKRVKNKLSQLTPEELNRVAQKMREQLEQAHEKT